MIGIRKIYQQRASPGIEHGHLNPDKSSKGDMKQIILKKEENKKSPKRERRGVGEEEKELQKRVAR